MIKKTRYTSTLSLLIVLASANTTQASDLDIDGELSIGVINFDIDQPNTVVGRYNGIHDDDRKLLAEFDLTAHPGDYYLSLDGSNLGLDTRQLGAEWGRHGLFDLSFEHSQIHAFSGVNAYTPYEGVGSNQLTLPDGFVGGETPGDMNLSDHLKPINLATERRSNRLEFKLKPSDSWNAALAFFRDTRNGTQSLGGAVGVPGPSDQYGYPAIVLPAPVDQVTDNIEAAFGFHNQTIQWEINYQWSRFNNRFTGLNWENPYDATVANPLTYSEQNLSSLEPDNSYHNLGLSSALNITPRTRLTLVANVGRMRQNSTMLDYTINPSSVITDPLTQTSAQAARDTRRLHLKLTSKPLRRLTFNLGYKYDKTLNDTPITLYQRVVNDSGDQYAADSSRANYNLPYEQTRSRLKLDSGYYFGRGTSLKLALSQENIDRTHRAIETTRERSASAKLNSRFNTHASFGLGLQRDIRKARGNYDPSRVFLAYHTEEYIDTVPLEDRFSNNPALRQYDIADRNRDKVNLNLNLYPHPDIVVGLSHSLNREDYADGHLGLEGKKQKSSTLDLSFTPNQEFTLFGYLTYETIDFAIDGRNFSDKDDINLIDNNWTVSNYDTLHTLGLGSRFSLLRDDLTISIQAFYSRERNRLDIVTGDAIDAVQLPLDQAKRKGIEVEADYFINSLLDIRLGLAYETFKDSEWSRDVIPPGSDASEELITLMNAEPDYTAYIAYTALRFKW